MQKFSQGTFTIIKRELKAYFESPVAYVFIIIFLLLSGFFTFYVSDFFENNQADLQACFKWLPWLFLILMPAVTMRLWAEDRRTGTIELILTLPLSLPQIILGKFLAAWLFIGLALILTSPLIFTVLYLGHPDMGALIAGYFGSFVMAGAYLSIGIMTSSLTRNQVISFVLSLVICLFFVLAGWPPVTDALAGWAPLWLIDIISNFSFMTHFNSLARGIIDLRDLIYFFSVMFFTLFANGVILQNRKAA